jgi:hypothetical protein
MPKQQKNVVLKETLFKKMTTVSRKISSMGQQVRRRVFGFNRRSTTHTDRMSLPVKVLHDHRLVQRRRAFNQAGGTRSGIALHALKKAQTKQKP